MAKNSPETSAERQRRYLATEKGKEAVRRYNASEKGRAARSRYHKKKALERKQEKPQ